MNVKVQDSHCFNLSQSGFGRKRARVCLTHANPGTTEPLPVSSRRETLLAWTLLISQTLSSTTTHAAEEPKAPEVGSCVECIGEVNGGLNACTLTSPSCVSTQNDDEAHFIPPWQYNGDMKTAVMDLVNLVTGAPPGSSKTGYINPRKDVGASKGNKAEQGLRVQPQEPPCFNGRLESRHSIEDGSEYLHFVFGGKNSEGQACRNIGVIDAEFIFLSGDNIVDIRTASRQDPGLRGGNVTLSLSYGVQYDTNIAKREMEEMRKALRWEQTPVVTDFDPRFNQRRPLFFEKLYQPFLRDKQNFEDIVDK